MNNTHTCEVTFSLSMESAALAKTVHIVGEFNNWNIYATPMKRLNNGTFAASIDLKRNKEYQFRYLIDFTQWENDSDADKYVQTSYGDCENSVVVV